MIYGSPEHCGIEGCTRLGPKQHKAGTDGQDIIHCCLFHFVWIKSQVLIVQKEKIRKRFNDTAQSRA